MDWANIFEYLRAHCPILTYSVEDDSADVRLLRLQLSVRPSTIDLICNISKKIRAWRIMYPLVGGIHVQPGISIPPEIITSLSVVGSRQFARNIRELMIATEMLAFEEVTRENPMLLDGRTTYLRDVRKFIQLPDDLTVADDFRAETIPGLIALSKFIEVILLLQIEPDLERTRTILVNSSPLIINFAGVSRRVFKEVEELLNLAEHQLRQLFEIKIEDGKEELALTNCFDQELMMKIFPIESRQHYRVRCPAMQALNERNENAIQELVIWALECISVYWPMLKV